MQDMVELMQRCTSKIIFKYHVSPATYDHIEMIRKSIPSASLIYSITAYHILYQFRIGKRYHGSE